MTQTYDTVCQVNNYVCTSGCYNFLSNARYILTCCTIHCPPRQGNWQTNLKPETLIKVSKYKSKFEERF